MVNVSLEDYIAIKSIMEILVMKNYVIIHFVIMIIMYFLQFIVIFVHNKEVVLMESVFVIRDMKYLKIVQKEIVQIIAYSVNFYFVFLFFCFKNFLSLKINL